MKYTDLTGFTLERASPVLDKSGYASLSYRIVSQPRESGEQYDDSWRVLYTEETDKNSLIVAICKPLSQRRDNQKAKGIG